jgi:O-antigen/teichoic acid export membrane protein
MTQIRFFANLAGQAWAALVAFVVSPILVQLLGDGAYGIVAFHLTLQVWLSLLEAGLGTAALRSAALAGVGPDSADVGVVRSAHRMMLLISAVIAMLGALAAPLLVDHWIEVPPALREDAAFGLRLSGMCIGLRVIESFHRSVLMGTGRQVLANSGFVACTAVRGLLPIAAMHVTGPGLRTFFLGLLLSSGLSAVAMGLLSRAGVRATMPGRASLPAALSLLRESRWILVGSLSWTAVAQVDKLMVSRIVAVESFAHYSLATQLAGIIPFLCAPLSMSLLPTLIRCRSSGDFPQAFSRVRAGLQACAVISGTCACTLLIHGAPVVQTWLRGPALSDDVSRFLVPLTIGAALSSITVMPHACAVAAGRFAMLARYLMLLATLAIPSLAVAGGLFGAIGLAWAWAGVCLVNAVGASIALVGEFVPARGRALMIRDVLLPWLASAAASGAIHAVCGLDWVRVDGILEALASALAALLAAVCVSPALRPVIRIPIALGRGAP